MSIFKSLTSPPDKALCNTLNPEGHIRIFAEGSLKALVKGFAKPGLEFREVPIPTLGPEDVLIKVAKAGICGTDRHIFDWDEWSQTHVCIGTTLGHEFCGVVSDIGNSVSSVERGDRVTAESHLFCGRCACCLSGDANLCINGLALGVNMAGAFADYISVPATNVIHLPEAVSDNTAVLLDPLGNAVHSVLAQPVAGKNIVVTGAGPIGLMAIAVAKHCGASSISAIDTNPFRLEAAISMGATQVSTATPNSGGAYSTEVFSRYYDVGLEMSGSADAINTLTDLVRPAGHIAALGIVQGPVVVNWNKIVGNGLTLQGIYGRKVFRTWDTMFNMIISGLFVEDLITDEFQFCDALNAFSDDQDASSVKTILTMS